ncbi:MAG: hypothetical protein VZR00_12395, partial [Lachnospiraceae bacterium]|nr:hypothetical protein [Lachnospiraceae bacterium]
SIPFDSDTPNLALDSVIDFITSKFIADTPALSVTKEIAYDAEAYKGFPVFSGENYSDGLVPVSKIVFLGKHTNSLGLLLFCTKNGIYYDLHICIMPSFDMMCVTPATYGENYQSSADACKYIWHMLRGWSSNSLRHIETRLRWDVTPGDSEMINMSIVSAGSADYGYAYIINSGNTSYTQFHIGFVRQGESALSMWWKNNNAGLFDLDYQYPLKAGVFSPKGYNVETYNDRLNNIIADTTGMDYLNDDVAHKIILIGYTYNNIGGMNCGLHQFFLGNNQTLKYGYDSNIECMQPTLENLAGNNKARSFELWSGESFPHLTGEQIFLRQLLQPLSLVAFTSVYRLAL